MIKFKTLKYKNFLSTGDSFTEIDLVNTENTLVIGANGSGKTTFLDALCFVLFGKAFRNINKPQLVNVINGKGCLVEIEFSIGTKEYKVIRGIKPTVFEIWCDGIFLNQDSSSKDYQDHLEKLILRMNYKSFTQIIILGSAAFTPFMKLTPADRRLVIEDLLDIQVFSVMNSIARTRLQTNKELLENNKIKSIGKEEKKDYITKSIQTLEKNNVDRIQALQEQILDNEKQSKILQEQIVDYELTQTEIQNKILSLPDLRKKHSKILVLESKLNTKNDSCSEQLKFFLDKDDCPTCHQHIDDAFKKSEVERLQTQIKELELGITQIKKTKDDCDAEIRALELLEKEFYNVQSNIKSKNVQIKSLAKHNKELEQEIQSVEKSDATLETSKKELESVILDIDSIQKEREELLNERLLIETSINLLKDGGIKTKIIKQYLPVINQLINKYLKEMNFYVTFELNESFEETIKSRYKDTFSYENFSQGEKQRIDLALLFTWRSIAKMRNSVNANLLIFDEILDGSLDGNGTDEFLKLMWGLVGDTNTFVISHKDALVDKFKRVLVFNKKQNFSVVRVR